MPKLKKSAHARKAALKRWHGDSADTSAVDAEMRYESAENAARRIVDGWPPLTKEQRERLAAIVRGDAA